ncbi:MAG TPA: DUF4864 domain-containing protein [Terriglobales bacterium]|nr:DUF4864 domain-containing protein [Terriglobales bacterium]
MPGLPPTVRQSRYRRGPIILAAILLLASGQKVCGAPMAQAQAGTLFAQAETQPADPATIQAIHGIISDQMAAFRRDDATAAFNDASPFIQSRFQRPDIFLEMVKSGYAPVYRPQQVEFRDLVPAADGLDQRVFVLGPDGRAYLAHYLMQRQPDGGWKINGCILEVLDDRST